VAGASEGIGAAFADALARRGLNVALVARRRPVLENLAAFLRNGYGVDVLPIVADLATDDMLHTIQAALDGRNVGLVVANAALSLVGPFLDHPLDAHFKEIDVNCRAPMALAHAFGRDMAQRQRGGIILLSSLAGFQGGPHIANYAADDSLEHAAGEFEGNLEPAEPTWQRIVGRVDRIGRAARGARVFRGAPSSGKSLTTPSGRR
jgi:short-subunit dehydrogenase